MSGSVTARPSICLNMIVKNEAHVVAETLDAVAQYISSWVIVDTGSDDGTQDVIRNHMSRLGIPGELYERPWVNFGHNRSEALVLAQRRADYIWVMDADDTIVGTLDLTQLTAEIYKLRTAVTNGAIMWKNQLFRDGLPIRYVGVVHECIEVDRPCHIERLEGDYHIEYRHRGARSKDPETFARDRDLLLAEIDRNPEDPRTVINLAQSYFFLGDNENARKWYRRRAEMGGVEEEIFHAKYRIAESLHLGGAPWPDVQDAYLTAWEFRPTRAEALHAIAQHYRQNERYRLAYQFARLAAEIPFPQSDALFARPDVHAFRAAEEQAVCASMLGKPRESLAVFRAIIARPEVPDTERLRIARNRDVCVQTMANLACAFNPKVTEQLAAGPHVGDVTVSLIAGPDRSATEYTLNSFLHCCTDVSRVGRFLVVDAGLSAEDRGFLLERYPFLEFGPTEGPDVQLAHIRSQVDGRFWLHLCQGWVFFAPERLIARLVAVLEAEPEVVQVGINFTDAVNLTGTCATETAVRRSPAAGRYVLGAGLARGPAMFDLARLDGGGGLGDTAADPTADLGRRPVGANRPTASLDEVLCVCVGRKAH